MILLVRYSLITLRYWDFFVNLYVGALYAATVSNLFNDDFKVTLSIKVAQVDQFSFSVTLNGSACSSKLLACSSLQFFRRAFFNSTFIQCRSG